ncbi:MAG TPA: cytidylate kinase family protein [Gaiellaceae bacterium]|nr:cytidylate kinase family protein [Gaiellaceae bacterium]
MAVWTISAQEGTPGERVAAELAAAADVPLYDRVGLAELARRSEIELPELDQIEERFCGRYSYLMLMAAGAAAVPDTLSELKLREALPELGRVILGEAARSACVIEARAAFAVLQEHPTAVHVRLRAPFEHRVATYQREHLVDRHRAEKAVKHADHLHHAWVRTLYHLDVDDDSRFTLVLDASRLSPDRIVEILLAAGGSTRTDLESSSVR